MASGSISGTNLRLLLWQELWPQDITNPESPFSDNVTPHCALWLQSGRIDCNADSITEGCGFYHDRDDSLRNTGETPATVLRFAVCKPDEVNLQSTVSTDSGHTSTVTRSLVFAQDFIADSSDAILRLDQVDFPPGAIAYKHTHPGAGARYLVFGGLQLESEHGTNTIKAGDAWFEAANSPVRAIAIEGSHSRFVRLMLLPVEFEGKPTLTLVNDGDRDKPRLQTNTRHFDKRITL